MATSEIDKLERRYAENPHGLTFAPLAEVHRKNGDVARALELLRVGLELHPNYIPASIVLGRCHQDLGDLAAAEAAFAHVLRLDDENVIALKSLADINERQDRPDEAQVWLRRLVAVDRSNDEARHQLRRLEALKESGTGLASPPATEVPPEVPHPTAVAEETPPVSSLAPEVVASPEPVELEPLDLTDEVAASTPPDDVVKPAAEPVTALPEPPPEPAFQDRPAASEGQAPVESPVAEVPHQGTEPGTMPGLISAEVQAPVDSPSGPMGLEIETEDDVVLRSSGASEFSVPDASEDLAAFAAKVNAASPRSPGRRAADRAAAERLAALAEAKAKPEAAPPAPPQPEPIAVLSAAYSVTETKGQSIAAFFQALLVARPPADSGEPTSPPSTSTEGGVPTRPAEEGLTLSSGFGEDSAPTPPAVPASGAAKAAGVSFDDFFGSSSGRTSDGGGAEPGKDDLDQFHSWLQNLKR